MTQIGAFFRTAILVFIAMSTTIATPGGTIADDNIPDENTGRAVLFAISGKKTAVADFTKYVSTKTKILSAPLNCTGPYDGPDWLEHKPHKGDDPKDKSDKGFKMAYICPKASADTFSAFGSAFLEFQEPQQTNDKKQPEIRLTATYTCTYYVCYGQRKRYKTGEACITLC